MKNEGKFSFVRKDFFSSQLAVFSKAAAAALSFFKENFYGCHPSTREIEKEGVKL